MCFITTQYLKYWSLFEIFALMRCFAHITQNHLNQYLICSYQCINSAFKMNVSHYYNNPMKKKSLSLTIILPVPMKLRFAVFNIGRPTCK